MAQNQCRTIVKKIWSFMQCKRQPIRQLIVHGVYIQIIYRNSHPEVFLKKGVLKICSKFTGEHPCQSVLSIELRLGCSVNLLHLFKTAIIKNSSEGLYLLHKTSQMFDKIMNTRLICNLTHWLLKFPISKQNKKLISKPWKLHSFF